MRWLNPNRVSLDAVGLILLTTHINCKAENSYGGGGNISEERRSLDDVLLPVAGTSSGKLQPTLGFYETA